MYHLTFRVYHYLYQQNNEKCGGHEYKAKIWANNSLQAICELLTKGLTVLLEVAFPSLPATIPADLKTQRQTAIYFDFVVEEICNNLLAPAALFPRKWSCLFIFHRAHSVEYRLQFRSMPNEK